MSDDAAETADRDGSDAADGDAADVDADAGATGPSESEATDGAAAGSEDEDGDETEDDLVARVAEHDEDLAAEVRDLRADLAAAEERIEDLESKLKRKAADFENYKKRAERRREELEERATEDLVERLVDVRDNLVRALDQDEDADIRDGVASTLAEFDRVLAEENVEPVEPDPGDELDPHRHEVLMRVESDRPEGTVADVHRPGYVMADRVLQTAQVTVSEGSQSEGSDDGESSPEEGGATDAEAGPDE